MRLFLVDFRCGSLPKKSDLKALLMKLDLTQTLVSQISLDKVLKDGAKYKGWSAASGPNYLVYDGQRDAPPGFALRVGKRSSVCGNIRVGIRVGFHTP